MRVPDPTKEELARVEALYTMIKQDIMESRVSGDEALTAIIYIVVEIIATSNTVGFAPSLDLFISALREESLDMYKAKS